MTREAAAFPAAAHLIFNNGFHANPKRFPRRGNLLFKYLPIFCQLIDINLAMHYYQYKYQ